MHAKAASSPYPFASTIASLVARSGRAAGPDADIRTARHVDLARFAGDWYVIASIPTPIDRDAVNAKEHYRIDPDGTIAATYRFRKGRPDGKEWTIRRTGIVRDDRTNAVWDVRLAGPIAADYRIVHVNRDYSQAVIGRNRRDFAWILARTPSIESRQLFEHVRRLREQGYDSRRLRTVPQDWA